VISSPSVPTPGKCSAEEIKGIGLKHGQFECVHPVHNGVVLLWCEHIQKYIFTGSDAEMIYAGQTLTVPIFPTVDIYADVHIGEAQYGPAAMLKLHYVPDIGKPFSVQLGLWNPGEGMLAIRSVIVDWLKGQLDPKENWEQGKRIVSKCPSSTHGVREARLVIQRSEQDLGWKLRCLWEMVMEKACTPCIELAEQSSGNFGIDESVIPKANKPWK